MTLNNANAHGVCTDTVRESTSEADSGREKKLYCRTGDSDGRSPKIMSYSQYNELFPLRLCKHDDSEGIKDEPSSERYLY